MMSEARWKVVDLKWWNKPIPLWDNAGKNAKRVGWVWNQRAYLVNNLHVGWVAFVNDQTEDNIDLWFCPHCKASIWGSWKDKIVEKLKETK